MIWWLASVAYFVLACINWRQIYVFLWEIYLKVNQDLTRRGYSERFYGWVFYRKKGTAIKALFLSFVWPLWWVAVALVRSYNRVIELVISPTPSEVKEKEEKELKEAMKLLES